jgi:AraC-like DNA-binding protein
MRSKARNRVRWKSLYSVVSPKINADGTYVWNFGPGLPVDVAHLKCSWNGRSRMNQHDFLEIDYLASGKLVWQVRDRFVTQQKGDLFLVSSWLYHRIYEFSSPPAKLIELAFVPEVIRSDCAHGDDAEYLMPFLEQDSKFQHIIAADTGIPAEVINLVHKLEQRLPATSDLDQLNVKCNLKLILLLLAEHYTNSMGSAKAIETRRRAAQRLRPVFELLEKHYAEPIHLADAASAMGMSRSRFTHFFKQMTGQTYVNYLNHFRVAHAQRLLSVAGASIAEVSPSVGFCDQSYFGRVFRLFTGFTPKQYQRNAVRSATKRIRSLRRQDAPFSGMMVAEQYRLKRDPEN